MTEYFIEQLVKRQTTIGTILKKVGLIVLTVLSLIVGPLIPLVGMLIPVIMVFLAFFLFKRMDIEYEYAFFNGDLDIDKVMGRESRKKLFSTNVKEMDLLAPTGAPELLGYQHLKAIDYTTCTEGNKTYEMVTSKGGEKVRIVFEPNEKMLNAMKDMAPRKVIF